MSGARQFKPRSHDPEPEKIDEGEGWLISYADLMTLLLGFFVVLYSFSKIDDASFAVMGKEISATFNGAKDAKYPDFFDSTTTVTEDRKVRALYLLSKMMHLNGNVDSVVSRIEQAAASASQLKDAKEIWQKNSSASTEKLVQKKSATAKDDQLLSAVTRMTEGDSSAVIELALPDSTLFAPGSNVLMESSKEKLNSLSNTIAQMKNLVQIQVIGHSDSQVATGDSLFNNNWALSSARAGAVASELILAGIDRRRIQVSGMADLQPLFPEQTSTGTWIPTNMAKNRRVHIIVKVEKGDYGENP